MVNLVQLLEREGIDGMVYADYMKALYDDAGIDGLLQFVLEITPAGEKGKAEQFTEEIIAALTAKGEEVQHTEDSDQLKCIPIIHFIESSSTQEKLVGLKNEKLKPVGIFDTNDDVPGELPAADCDYDEDSYFSDDNTDIISKIFALDLLLIDELSIGFSPQAIVQALSAARDNLAEAALILKESFLLASSLKPCRHALVGKCLRSDCVFDHSFHNVPCRFWLLQDGCLHDSDGSCPFPHSLTHLSSMSNLSVESSSDFPQLLEHASTIPRKADNRISSISYRDVLGHYSLPVNKQVLNVVDSERNGAVRKSVPVQQLSTMEWVASGETVRQAYESSREEARTYAISRNKFLQEATIAFMSGSKALARDLAARGRQCNEEMKRLHREAAQLIFVQRNSRESLKRGTLDLHGLHVAEALTCVEDLLPALLGCGSALTGSLWGEFLRSRVGLTALPSGNKTVVIVTGSGHHSKGTRLGEARLLPAVLRFLEDNKSSLIRRGLLRCCVIKDVNGFESGIKVSVS